MTRTGLKKIESSSGVDPRSKFTLNNNFKKFKNLRKNENTLKIILDDL